MSFNYQPITDTALNRSLLSSATITNHHHMKTANCKYILSDDCCLPVSIYTFRADMGTKQAQLPISLEFSQLKRFCFLLGKVSDTNQWDVLWSHVAQRPPGVRHTFVPLCYMGQSTTGSLLTLVNSTADG